MGWEAKQLQGSGSKLHLHLFSPPRVHEQNPYLPEVMGTAAQQSPALGATQDTKCSMIAVRGRPVIHKTCTQEAMGNCAGKWGKGDMSAELVHVKKATMFLGQDGAPDLGS